MSDKSFQKLPKIMPCPYHDCLPEYFKDEFNICGNIIHTRHLWFCPECKKNNQNPNKNNAFGYGYISQYSKSAALSNWNKAVCRKQMNMLKTAIKTGK